MWYLHFTPHSVVAQEGNGGNQKLMQITNTNTHIMALVINALETGIHGAMRTLELQ